MSMICAIARLIGIAVAIVAAFVAIPMTATILLVLGAISIWSYKPEDYLRVIISALLLLAGAGLLGDIPTVGAPLAAIFGNLGIFLVGGSVMAIAIRAYMIVKADWVKA